MSTRWAIKYIQKSSWTFGKVAVQTERGWEAWFNKTANSYCAESSSVQQYDNINNAYNALPPSFDTWWFVVEEVSC